MDNSRYGTGPSAEWTAFGAAHPELAIDADGHQLNSSEAEALELRAATNAGRTAGARALCERDGMADKVTTTDYDIPASDGSGGKILIRVYRPKDLDAKTLPVYIHYHGGGFLFGTRGSEDWASSKLALGAGVAVVHVCYRHTPEHRFPVPHRDAVDGFEWVIAHAGEIGVDPSRVVVGGISAGGNLAAAVVLREVLAAKREGRGVRVNGQVLAIPWLVHRDAYPWELFASKEKTSLEQCAGAPCLPRARYDLFHDLLRVEDPRDLLMSPALVPEGELGQGLMPRAAFVVDGWDVLRDEGFMYADKLERAGVPTKKHVFPGMPHAFRRHQEMASSGRWDELMVESVRWCLDEAAGADEKGMWAEEVSQK